MQLYTFNYLFSEIHQTPEKCDIPTRQRNHFLTDRGESKQTLIHENFEHGYPQSNVVLQFHLNLERCKQHEAACHPNKRDIINDVKLFPTVYTVYVIQSDFVLQNHVH